MKTAEVEVWVVPLEVGSVEAVVAAEKLLAADEREKMSRFVQPQDRRRFCLRRAARRQLLAKHCGVAPEALEFSSGPHGKPSVLYRGRPVPLHFNCSSSGDTALIAITTAGEIGVDLERHRPLGADLLQMAASFAPDERDGIAALVGKEQEQAFFDCWTRKEAVLKALGSGLARPLDSFSVSLAAGTPAVRQFDDDSAEAKRWTLVELPVATGHSATMASRFPMEAAVKRRPGT